MSASDSRVDQLRKIFTTCDRTGSGSLDVNQFEDAIMGMEMKIGPDRIGEIFARVDSDGDGFITFNEFVRGINQINSHSQSHYSKASGSMNASHDSVAMKGNASMNASRRQPSMSASGNQMSHKQNASSTGIPQQAQSKTGGNEKLYRLFKALDKDGDDVLSIKELQTVFSSFGDSLSDLEATEMIAYAKGGNTTDGTHGVSFDEFVRVMTE
eukprot:gnl/Chilomastix_caulleri/906.p1 GENE.gnl/Chilomastix_caulleri/906~~gnl/Chilomastix_caulleri/906.p1  ORF type:complete len:212 (-),score=41.56 gnl/Chilomastix_caulleri/906:131-766(-)